MSSLPEYDSPPLTFEEQANLLMTMGFDKDDNCEIDHLIRILQSVNYTRLKEYWVPFTQDDGKAFKSDTTLVEIWQRYRFDRRLRLVVFDAVERIEIAVRTMLVEAHTTHFKSSESYAFIPSIVNIQNNDTNLREKLKKALSIYMKIINPGFNDSETPIQSFRKRYSNKFPPFWVACEHLDFGNLCTLFKGVPRAVSSKIYKRFNVTRKIMKEWLNIIRSIRNICAHHSRLWNRTFTYRFVRPKEKTNPEWFKPIIIPESRKLFPILSMLSYMLKIIIPQSRWRYRLKKLIHDFPMIPLESMGFPEDWEKSPLWTDDEESKGAKHATV